MQDHIYTFNKLICQLLNADEKLFYEEQALLLLDSISKDYRNIAGFVDDEGVCDRVDLIDKVLVHSKKLVIDSSCAIHICGEKEKKFKLIYVMEALSCQEEVWLCEICF